VILKVSHDILKADIKILKVEYIIEISYFCFTSTIPIKVNLDLKE